MYGSGDRDIQAEDQLSLVAAIKEIRREQSDMRIELRKNTEATAKIGDMTEDLVSLFEAARGTFKVMGWIGKGITWLAGIAAAVGALWLVAKGGVFPPK